MGQIRAGRFDGKLTPLAVRRLGAPGLHADGAGLYLRVGEGGARSWVLFVHVGGRRREMGLGSATAYTLADARERARKYRLIADEGRDPIAVRAAEKTANAAATAARKTFKECAVEYIRLHSAGWKGKHAKDWPSSLERHVFPKLGARDIAMIGKADVLSVLEPIWLTTTDTATKVRGRIQLIMEWATARGYCNPDARLWSDVAASLPKPSKIRKIAHYPAAAYADVPGIIGKIYGSAATDTIKAAFSFCVLTAARSGEVRNATWNEIDHDRRMWVIPGTKMKSGREHRVPLSDAALAILAGRPRTVGDDQGLVFANPKGGPYSDMAFTALLRRLKIASTSPDTSEGAKPGAMLTATMHGFRSSFRDWASEQTSTPHDIMEAALAHARGDETVRAYARSDLFDKRRTLMEAWAAYCRGAA